jgi:hypothetical protein
MTEMNVGEKRMVELSIRHLRDAERSLRKAISVLPEGHSRIGHAIDVRGRIATLMKRLGGDLREQ